MDTYWDRNMLVFLYLLGTKLPIDSIFIGLAGVNCNLYVMS